MKFKNILYLLLTGLLATSCFNDDTTYDTVQIAEISIDTLKLQKVYNIDKNMELLITPEIAQSNTAQPLSYEWEVNYKTYSDSSALRYDGDKLGSFPARLKVSNAHGSAFYQFTINVNSPYEEGIAILSESADHTPMLSFMRKFSKEELAAGAKEEFVTNCLTVNNPGITFAKSPTDMAKYDKQLFISCKDEPTIYVLNTKTFELENIITTPEYPELIPQKMQVFDVDIAEQASIYSESGQVYILSPKEGVVTESDVLFSSYSPAQTYNTRLGEMCSFYFWDEMQSTLVTGLTMYDYMQLDYFGEGYMGLMDHTPLAIFNNTTEDYDESITMLSEYEGEYYKTTIGGMLFDFDWVTGEILGPAFPEGEPALISGTTTLTPESPYTSNTYYRTLVYADGNKLYRWYFSDTSFPEDPWVSITDLSDAEITCLANSPDNKQLYVGVQATGATGLNGYLYIFDSDTGEQVAGSPYKNVSHKPVQIIYKKK